MYRKLGKGKYQMQIKKYSFGFDVFDFTARIYSEKNIDLVDLEEQEIKKNKEKLERKKLTVGGTRTITESSNPTSQDKKRFTKAGNQDTNEKKMIDIDPHTQIDMEMHKQDNIKDIQLEEVKQTEKGSSNGRFEIIKGPLV